MLAGFVIAIVAGACAGGGSDTTRDVEMRLIALRPENISIEAGDRVRWTQKDAGTHTVTSGVVKQEASGVRAEPDGRFESGSLATDANFAFTFEEPGTYPYFCAVHPATMRGVITVT